MDFFFFVLGGGTSNISVKNSGFHLNEVQSVTEIDQDGRMTFRELTNQLPKVKILHLLLRKRFWWSKDDNSIVRDGHISIGECVTVDSYVVKG